MNCPVRKVLKEDISCLLITKLNRIRSKRRRGRTTTSYWVLDTIRLGKGIIPSCKIHMMEEGILDGCPKGGGKEELGEGEGVSLNTLSLRKTKI